MADPIRDCPHGHMKGKCDSCDLIVAEARIAALEEDVASWQRVHRRELELTGSLRKEMAALETENKKLSARELGFRMQITKLEKATENANE